MEIIIKFTSSDYRITEYFLQQRYKSKKKLPALAKVAIQREAAAQAKIDLEKNN
jgi:hypothetical protein